MPRRTAKTIMPNRGSPPLNTSTLEKIRIGSTACVSDVQGEDSTALRLLEMGLTPGASVKVVAAAPLGDPLELELRGYRLSIRRSDAARVAIAR
jgi:ferrous iron transport protein A